MSAEIAIVVSPRPWAEHLHRFVADHGGARVRARVLDAREAVSEHYQVLVAEDLTSFLTPRLVDEIHRNGRVVLGVFDPTDDWGRTRLHELGVDEVISASEDPEEFVRVIHALALTASVDLDAELAGLVDGREGAGALTTPAPAAPPARPVGQVTVIGGPSGGVGGTELAIEIAAAIRRRGETVVLLDADDIAPSVAPRLGLPQHPNIRTAIDIVQHWTGDLQDALTPVPGGAFEVVAGIAQARDWAEVRPGEVVDVITELTRRRQHVVVDVGHVLDDLGGFGSPGRFGLSRAVIALADTVVAVGAPTPVGVARLLEWIADVRAITRATLQVAFNRVGTGGFKRGELEDELRRTYSPPVLTFLPEDRHVADAAWAGTVVRGGAFARSVASFTDAVVPRVAGAGFTARAATPVAASVPPTPEVTA